MHVSAVMAVPTTAGIRERKISKEYEIGESENWSNGMESKDEVSHEVSLTRPTRVCVSCLGGVSHVTWTKDLRHPSRP
jgi:hypothetical protein